MTMIIVSAAMRIIRVSVIVGMGSMFVRMFIMRIAVTMCMFCVMMPVLHRVDDRTGSKE
jgi:hypothetical protein